MIEAPTQTSQCPSCRAAVAEDQNYCLSCGARQPRARMRAAQPAPGVVVSATDTVRSNLGPERDWTPVLALGGLAALALVLVIGVLIGRSGQGATKAAAAPQVIQLQGGGTAAPTSGAAGASTATAVGKISDEWPVGKSGWTVALQSLVKSAATPGAVAAAKASAAGKGAKSVGVLDALNYTSLGTGYVIYSGIYTSKAPATAALAKLKKSFPAAKVIHVVQPGSSSSGGASAGPPPTAAQQQAGAAAISALTNCSGSACSKAARKITQPIATPGTAPPKDNKPAGGGGAGQGFQ